MDSYGAGEMPQHADGCPAVCSTPPAILRSVHSSSGQPVLTAYLLSARNSAQVRNKIKSPLSRYSESRHRDKRVTTDSYSTVVTGNSGNILDREGQVACLSLVRGGGDFWAAL